MKLFLCTVCEAGDVALSEASASERCDFVTIQSQASRDLTYVNADRLGSADRGLQAIFDRLI